MKTKMIEIRDCRKVIPAIAIKYEGESQRENDFFEVCAQYSQVILIDMEFGVSQIGPILWESDTLRIAHNYIKENFDKLPCEGSVIDVQYLLKNKAEPALSEIWEDDYEI